MKCNETLETLNLSHNDQAAKVITQFAGSLASSKLKSLDLSSNQIQNNGGVALSEALNYNKTLE